MQLHIILTTDFQISDAIPTVITHDQSHLNGKVG